MKVLEENIDTISSVLSETSDLADFELLAGLDLEPPNAKFLNDEDIDFFTGTVPQTGC